MGDKRGKQSKSPTSNVRSDDRPRVPSDAGEAGAESLFPIVGIGASAGGLEASTELLKALPGDTGMAFVFVHHLAPEHDSMLVDILARASEMPVAFAEDGQRVQPNMAYVIPPDSFLAIFHGTLSVVQQHELRGERTAIDYFLRSLAEDQRSLSIGVVLSGTGSDGALGIRAIKSEDGITFVQDPDTAAYDGMPRAALESGVVDFVLAPRQIAEELVRVSKHPLLRTARVETAPPDTEERQFETVYLMLRNATGVDFTDYKPTTMRRRIARRMVVHHLDVLADYVTYLKEHPDEIKILYQDLLINVTGFFREPDSFEALKKDVFPHLLEGRGQLDAIRIWVPGCSTGEEPYSIAMALTEYLEGQPVSPPIQIFATDISDTSIEKARQAVYPDNIVAEISPGRLSRFFTKTEAGYQVNKSIRDMCIFAKHDVTRDPPFSRIDLLSCRNLLIYLGRVLQRSLIPIFHYALNPRGFLLLGSSESVGDYTELFTAVNTKFKIYSKNPGASRPPLTFGYRPYSAIASGRPTPIPRQRDEVQADVQQMADRVAMDRFAPPSVLINQELDILQFRGDTSPFLSHPSGRATLNLIEMARPGLDTALRSHFAQRPERPPTARIPEVRVRQNGHWRAIDVEIVPIPRTGNRRYIMVFFKDPAPSREARAVSGEDAADSDVERLRRDLENLRHELRSSVEEKEASVEELRAANEEVQSSNEELQSINEELETAKEELQSTNEELTTLNEELQNRNFELLSMNDDFRNVLASVNIPIIILGKDLRIRRYTPMAERVLSLIPSDVGRPITDLKLKIEAADLPRMIADVLQELTVVERDVRDESGHWFRLQIRPYRTSDDRIQGVVITMLDIEDMKAREQHHAGPSEDIIDSRAYLAGMLETVIEPFVVLDEQFRILGSSEAFAEMLGAHAGDLASRHLDEIGAHEQDVKRLLDLVAHAEKTGAAEGELELATAAARRFRVRAGRIDRKNAAPLVLLAMSPTT